MAKRTVLSLEVDDVEKRRYPSKHYVYVIAVSWSDGAVNVIYRRYSRFFELQSILLDKFPVEGGERDPTDRIIPFLPGKILFGRSHVRQVALKRLTLINDYCKTLIKLPSHISECREVLHFFEAHAEDLLPQHQLQKQPEPVAVIKESISEPMVLQQYLVVADYETETSTEISLTAGSVVEVVEKTDKGWWFVISDKDQGWVASSYLERLDGQEEQKELDVQQGDAKKYVCIRSYIPQLGDEIELDKGGLVEVLERNLDGWWLVRYKGKTGRAPGLFLRRTDTIKANRLANRKPQLAVEVIKNVMSLSEDEAEASPDAAASKQNPAHKPKPKKVGVPQPPSSQDVRPRSAATNSHGMTAGHSRALPQARTTLLVPDSTVGLSDSDCDGSPLLLKKRPLPPRPGSIKKQATSPEPVFPSEEMMYVATADFTNQAQDGIDLKQGCAVKVIEKTTTGWWYVKTDGVEGWAPESYFERVQKQKAKPARPPPPSTKLKTQSQNLEVSGSVAQPSEERTIQPGPPTTGLSNIAAELQRKLAVRSAAISNSNNAGHTTEPLKCTQQRAVISPQATRRSNALKGRQGVISASSRASGVESIQFRAASTCHGKGDERLDSSSDYEDMTPDPPCKEHVGTSLYQNIDFSTGSTGTSAPQQCDAKIAKPSEKENQQTSEDYSHDYLELIDSETLRPHYVQPSDKGEYVGNKHDYVNTKDDANSIRNAVNKSAGGVLVEDSAEYGHPTRTSVAAISAKLNAHFMTKVSAAGAKPKVMKKPLV